MSVASLAHRRFVKRGQVVRTGQDNREHLLLKLEVCSRRRPLHAVTIPCVCCHLMCTFHVGHRLDWCVHAVFTCREQDGDRLYGHKHRTEHGGVPRKSTKAIMDALAGRSVILSHGPDVGMWYFDPTGATPDPRTGRINKGAACMQPSVACHSCTSVCITLYM